MISPCPAQWNGRLQSIRGRQVKTQTLFKEVLYSQGFSNINAFNLVYNIVFLKFRELAKNKLFLEQIAQVLSESDFCDSCNDGWRQLDQSNRYLCSNICLLSYFLMQLSERKYGHQSWNTRSPQLCFCACVFFANTSKSTDCILTSR